MNCRKYTTDTKIFLRDGQADTDCNSVIFYNTGTNPVNVDGVVLQQGQQFRIEGNENEQLVKVYNFQFSGALVSELTVIYKRYI
jgi:hypothetical protein